MKSRLALLNHFFLLSLDQQQKGSDEQPMSVLFYNYLGADSWPLMGFWQATKCDFVAFQKLLTATYQPQKVGIVEQNWYRLFTWPFCWLKDKKKKAVWQCQTNDKAPLGSITVWIILVSLFSSVLINWFHCSTEHSQHITPPKLKFYTIPCVLNRPEALQYRKLVMCSIVYHNTSGSTFTHYIINKNYIKHFKIQTSISIIFKIF